MKQVIFDFGKIKSLKGFYTLAAKELQLPEHFGNNLDALWDCVTAEIELPVEVQFINLSMEQLDKFRDLIALFEDAVTELGDDLLFEYYMKDESE